MALCLGILTAYFAWRPATAATGIGGRGQGKRDHRGRVGHPVLGHGVERDLVSRDDVGGSGVWTRSAAGAVVRWIRDSGLGGMVVGNDEVGEGEGEGEVESVRKMVRQLRRE